MKAVINGLRAKELSLMTIALMCTTILVWAWQKTPLLSTTLPNTRLQLSPDTNDAVVGSVPLEQQLDVDKDDLRFVGKHGIDDKDGHHADRRDAPESSSGNLVITHLQGKENSLKASEEEIEHKQTVEAEGTGASDRSEMLTKVETVKDSEPESEKRSDMEGAEVEGIIKQRVETNYSSHGGESKNHETSIGRSSNSSFSISITDRDKETAIVKSKACNYAKGKWVVDKKRPLYSGFGCKQWLSGMWSCRLNQRTDFAYEKLRWQPKGCTMEEFEGSKFLRRMQNKTLAFVGDSLGRQQFQSLMCMITGGEERSDVIDVGAEFGLFQAPGDTRPSGWAFRFQRTNTTILYYWSASLCDLEPIDKTKTDSDVAMHLDRPPAFLRQFIHRFDVLVLNTGHHWNRGKLKANRWVMHVGGKPNTDMKLARIWSAKNLTIYSVVNWVNSQLPKYPVLKAFYRTISPRHFVGGEWNTGGSCGNMTPMSVGKEVLQDESSDQSAAGAVKGTGVRLLDITALSQIRDEGHISKFSLTAKGGQDCLHWCLPGVPDTWNEILFAHISSM